MKSGFILQAPYLTAYCTTEAIAQTLQSEYGGKIKRDMEFRNDLACGMDSGLMKAWEDIDRAESHARNSVCGWARIKSA